ncbi:hypothetical protein AR687_18155 [Flavobacteriaceae bacterium CRH]|nr:hypothetical protein AR687_18155 [Flavobacteriaceae bacterium CRH]
MTNCATEEINEDTSTAVTPISEAKKWYDSHKGDYNASVLKFAKDLQWNNAIVTNGNIGNVVEVPFTLDGSLSTSNKNGTLFNARHRLMFVKDKQNKFSLYYVQIFSNTQDKKVLDKDFNYYNVQNDFDGKVYVQDLSTKTAHKVEFKKGVEIKPSVTSKTDSYFEPFCVYYGYWYEDGHFEPLELLYCTLYDTSENMPIPVYAGGGGGTGGTGGTAGSAAVPIKTEAQFIELVDGTNAEGYDITLTFQPDSRLSSVTANILPWAWATFVVKSEKVGTKYDVVNVTSMLNGNITTLKWSQVDYATQVNNTTNVTYVHVIGTITNTVLMPLGPSHELAYNINYSIQVNRLNGRVISADKL